MKEKKFHDAEMEVSLSFANAHEAVLRVFAKTYGNLVKISGGEKITIPREVINYFAKVREYSPLIANLLVSSIFNSCIRYEKGGVPIEDVKSYRLYEENRCVSSNGIFPFRYGQAITDNFFACNFLGDGAYFFEINELPHANVVSTFAESSHDGFRLSVGEARYDAETFEPTPLRIRFSKQMYSGWLKEQKICQES